MCGRYVLIKSIELLEKKYQLYVTEEIKAFQSYNIKPGDRVPVQYSDRQQSLDWGHFGWPPRGSLNRMLINATAEKMTTSSFWRPAFSKRRCVIWCNGFYEGPKKEKLKKPYLIYHQKYPVFPLAGIWENSVIEDTGETFRSFAIITTTPNNVCQRIGHHRSPVILSSVKRWLNVNEPLSDATQQLAPIPSGHLNAFRVSTEMTSGKEDHPGLILPMEEPIIPEFSANIRSHWNREGHGRVDNNRSEYLKMAEHLLRNEEE